MNPFRNAPASTFVTVLLTAVVGIGVFNTQPTAPGASTRPAAEPLRTEASYLPAQYVEQQRAAAEQPLPAQF